MKMGQVLGGRRKGPRTKKGKKKSKPVKVALKIKGTAEQVQKAAQSFAKVGVNEPSESQAVRGDHISDPKAG
jgi:phage tail tape-measure protein